MCSYKLKKEQDKIWKIEECSNLEIPDSKYLLHSQIDKDLEKEMLLGSIDFNYHKNFIIFGIKNIELLLEIYKKKTPASTMIIIEICDNPDESISINCEKQELAFLFDKSAVTLAIGTRDEVAKQIHDVITGIMKLYNLRNTEIISLPYVKSMYPNEIQSLTKVIMEKLTTFLMSYGNSVDDILIGMDNYLDNWGHTFRGVDFSRFKDIYKGKPAIIVGAGPSLDKNKHYLKKIKGKALILCVDAALNSLLDQGIVPDMVASIERMEVTAKFYQRKDIPEEIVFLGPNIIRESIIERFDRLIFTGRVGDALVRDFNNYIGFNNLEIGGNVSNIVIAFAEYLGCNPIAFIGLDLAYTGGKTHTVGVEDTLGEKTMGVYKKKDSIVYVKGQNGEMLETLEFFMYAKNWIEMKIAGNRQQTFINATEGGAMIEGATNQALMEVIDKYCGEEIEAFVDVYDRAIEENKINKLDTTKKAFKYIKELDRYFKLISTKADEYFTLLNNSEQFGLVELLEKLRGKMEESLSANSAGRFILQSIIISYNRDIHSFPMYLTKEDKMRMLERSLEFYDTAKKVSNRVSEDLKAYKKVLARYLKIYKVEEGAV